MAVIKNAKQVELYDLYKGYTPKKRMRYTALFKAMGNEYMSNRSTLSLKDMFDNWEYAGIGKAGDMLKVLSNNGVNVLEITPPQVGSQVSFSPEELEMINSSQAQEAYGYINLIKEIEAKKVKKIASSVVNTTELMAQSIFLTGVYGDFDFGIPAATALTLKNADDLATQIIDQIEKFEVENGYQGRVFMGSKGINALMNQARSTSNSKANNTSITLADKFNDAERGSGFTFMLGAYNVEIEKLPLARKEDGTFIDTSEMMIITAMENLGVGYAGVKVSNPNNIPDILKTDLYVDLGTVTDKRNPDVFIFGKGFPLPVIANEKLHRRFTLTIS